MPGPEHSPQPRPTDLQPVTGPFALVDADGMQHLASPGTRAEFLQIDDTITYPRDVEPGSALGEAVLREVAPGIFALPGEYISVQHALNEATGAVGQAFGDPNSSRAQNGQAAYAAVFRGMAETVGNIAAQDHLIPIGMSYRRLILETGAGSPRVLFLPPVEFVPADPIRERKGLIRVADDLGVELLRNADSAIERRLIHRGLHTFAVTLKRRGQ